MKHLSDNVGAILCPKGTRQGLGVTVARKVSLPAIYYERCGWVAPTHEKGELI